MPFGHQTGFLNPVNIQGAGGHKGHCIHCRGIAQPKKQAGPDLPTGHRRWDQSAQGSYLKQLPCLTNFIRKTGPVSWWVLINFQMLVTMKVTKKGKVSEKTTEVTSVLESNLQGKRDRNLQFSGKHPLSLRRKEKQMTQRLCCQMKNRREKSAKRSVPSLGLSCFCLVVLLKRRWTTAVPFVRMVWKKCQQIVAILNFHLSAEPCLVRTKTWPDFSMKGWAPVVCGGAPCRKQSLRDV